MICFHGIMPLPFRLWITQIDNLFSLHFLGWETDCCRCRLLTSLDFTSIWVNSYEQNTKPKAVYFLLGTHQDLYDLCLINGIAKLLDPVGTENHPLTGMIELMLVFTLNRQFSVKSECSQEMLYNCGENSDQTACCKL